MTHWKPQSLWSVLMIREIEWKTVENVTVNTRRFDHSICRRSRAGHGQRCQRWDVQVERAPSVKVVLTGEEDVSVGE